LGAGVEIAYVSGSTTGIVQTYDRTGGAYRNLDVKGLQVDLRTGAGVTSTLLLDSSNNATFAGKIILSGTDKHLIADDTASTVYLSGGNASNVGGNISLYGTTTGSNQGDILFRSGSTQVGLWDESQTAWHLNGRLDLSDATNAGQIKFPATQNASSDPNTLDDYEEGTFTPTWTSDGTAPSIGNGVLSGKYTKIGNRVDCVMTFKAGSTTTFGTGNYSFALPFTAAASTGSLTSFTGVAYIDDTGTGWGQGTITGRSASATKFDINLVPIGSIGTARVTNTAPMTWANGDSLTASFTYFTA